MTRSTLGSAADAHNPSRPAELSLTEWTVLALLVEGPAHGFALAREFEPGSDLGRVLTVHRPLVYRALDRLDSAGLVAPHHSEKGRAGGQRTIFGVTPSGRDGAATWLGRPVVHIRDLRIEFLVKLRLIDRAGIDRRSLIRSQRAAITEPLDNLMRPGEGADEVDLWRMHNARAAMAFLHDLAPA